MTRAVRMRVSPQVGSLAFGAARAPGGAVLLEGQLHDDVDPQRLIQFLRMGQVTLEVVEEELAAAASPEGVRRGRGRSAAASTDRRDHEL